LLEKEPERPNDPEVVLDRLKEPEDPVVLEFFEVPNDPL